jgi:Holliday junction resolvase RusA-like endonuclease
MSVDLHFTVPAVPVPQPRARATSFGGKARMYEAKAGHAIHDFKAQVRLAATAAHTGGLLDGPLHLFATFVLPRPKLPKKFGVDRLPHTKRGDLDNFAKAIMDALNKYLWVDDAQVFTLTVRKYVAAVDEKPHVEIVVASE